MIDIEEGHYYMAVLHSLKLRNAPVKIIKNYSNYSLAKTLLHSGAITNSEGYSIGVDFSSVLYEMTEEEAFEYINNYNPAVPVKGDPDFAIYK